MNIDGVVFHTHKASGDEFLDTNIHGCDVFELLRNVIEADRGNMEDVEVSLKCANDYVIDGILKDAHVNVGKTIDGNETYSMSTERCAKEKIILTLLRRGHTKWVSKPYKHWSE